MTAQKVPKFNLPTDDTKKPTAASPRTLNLSNHRGISLSSPRLLGSKHRATTIATVRSKPENSFCADCSAPNPEWGIVNIGCFVCIQCAGVHRSLGTHISSVRSCTLDTWTQEQIDFMASHGNEDTNAEYEFFVPQSILKPSPESERTLRQKYIEQKYKDRVFGSHNAPLSSRGGPTRREPEQAKDQTAREVIAPVLGEGNSLKVSDTNPKTKNRSSSAMILFMGTMSVFVETANHLRLTEADNPFCKLTVGTQKVRSRTLHNTKHPLWNEMLMVSIAEGDHLTIAVWNKDPMFDSYIGGATVALSQVPPSQDIKLRIPLQSKRKSDTIVLWQSVQIADDTSSSATNTANNGGGSKPHADSSNTPSSVRCGLFRKRSRGELIVVLNFNKLI
eukprot:c5187_g1_i1.p1 GENE.c5187_g1_i1~~c5187_g1_i1.p1  ORF type:complete len:401 (+),score=64.58 c5187_g1_i1:32-1204(+)